MLKTIQKDKNIKERKNYIMLTDDFKTLVKILKKEIAPAAGCTEPVAVAYSTAVARESLGGEVESLEIWVDPGLYKNGLRVGIPGIKARGLDIAASLGALVGDSKKGLCVLEGLTEEDEQRAKDLIKENKVKIKLRNDSNRLYIESILKTNKGQVRVLTLDKHQNIVKIEKGEDFEKIELTKGDKNKYIPAIQQYDLQSILEFAKNIPVSEIAFLEEGVKMNMEVAEEGFKISGGISERFNELIKKDIMHDDMVSKAQRLCAAAAEARMSGTRLAVMSTAGSGNHGITVFLTNKAVALQNGTSKEELLRALALSILVTAYIKSYTGPLSAMCGCGVAAGVGASAGVVYQLGGSIEDMFGAMLNMIGSVAGLICDGAKEGCAYKLAVSTGWAVQSALLSIQGAVVSYNDGILSPDFDQLFKNLGYVCGTGMSYTNKTILDVMCSGI